MSRYPRDHRSVDSHWQVCLRLHLHRQMLSRNEETNQKDRVRLSLFPCGQDGEGKNTTRMISQRIESYYQGGRDQASLGLIPSHFALSLRSHNTAIPPAVESPAVLLRGPAWGQRLPREQRCAGATKCSTWFGGGGRFHSASTQLPVHGSSPNEAEEPWVVAVPLAFCSALG